MRYKNKTKAAIVLAVLFSACGATKRNLQSGVDAGMDRVFIVPMVVSQSLEDAARSIYANGGLKDGTSVTIEAFDVKFYGRQDSFPIRMNNIQFYRTRDSVYYQNFHFPKWDKNKYADTMRSTYRCTYLIPGGTATGCLTGDYSIQSGKIGKVADPKPCNP